MRNFHIFTVTAMVLILGFGSTLMAQKGQVSRDEVRVNWTENKPQARLLFVDENGGVKSRAARDLGITERILSYKIRTYGLEKPV